MKASAESIGLRAASLDAEVVAWRCEQLLAAGFQAELASGLARDPRHDLHELIGLVERGCRPELAARILAPLDEGGREGRFTNDHGRQGLIRR